MTSFKEVKSLTSPIQRVRGQASFLIERLPQTGLQEKLILQHLKSNLSKYAFDIKTTCELGGAPVMKMLSCDVNVEDSVKDGGKKIPLGSTLGGIGAFLFCT